MDFRITDVICGGNDKKEDVQKEFFSKVSKLGKKLQSNKKKLEINQTTDQRDQPYIAPSKETNMQIQDKSISIPKQEKEDDSDEPIDSPNNQLPKINPLKTLPIHVIPISDDQVTTSTQDENYIKPNLQPTLNPIHNLLECESQIENYEKDKIQKKQKQAESQLKLINKNKMVLPQFFRKTEKLNTPEKPPLLSDDYYYNDLVKKGEWSVIWDPKKLKKIPLILDKSDKYVSASNSSDSETKSPKEWNQLNLLDDKVNYYSEVNGMNDNNEFEIHHSNVATSLSLFEPNTIDHKHFHHPAYKPTLKKEMTIEILGSQRKESGFFQLNSIESLSGKNGKIFVIENISENQPFILNVGMNSLLLKYFFVDDDGFDFTTLPEDLNNELTVVNKNDKSPFIAQLPVKKPIQALYCPLFRMPIAMHSKSETDFLFVKDRTENKFYIRGFDKIFCSGLSEPQQEVMKPGSTMAQKVQDNLIEAFLINVFRGTSQMKRKEKFTISQLKHSYFSGINENKLRGFVKKYAEFKNGNWELMKENDLDSSFNKLGITPEKVCSYQSMLHGLWSLRKKGVNLFTFEPKLHSLINKLKGEKTKIVAARIELELMKTPWMKTSNFIGAFQSNALEMENVDGEEIYKKKSRRSKNPEKREAIRSKESKKEDLRKLSMEQMNQILRDNNFTEEQIDKLERWDKTKVVEKIAERKLQENPDDELAQKYSRKKNNFKEICKKYKNYYQQSFDNNLSIISSEQSTSVEKDGFDVDDDSFLNELGEMMNNNEEEDSNEIDLNLDQNNSSQKNSNNSDDPKQLVPYGICTYPTKIDWKAFGVNIEKVKMRPVVKFIRVTMNKNGDVSASVEWKRDAKDVDKCKKKHHVYQENLENDSSKKKKNIKKKSKKTVQVDENANHDVSISNEGDHLKLSISNESKNKINDARKTYNNYKNK